MNGGAVHTFIFSAPRQLVILNFSHWFLDRIAIELRARYIILYCIVINKGKIREQRYVYTCVSRLFESECLTTPVATSKKKSLSLYL